MTFARQRSATRWPTVVSCLEDRGFKSRLAETRALPYSIHGGFEWSSEVRS